MSFERGREAGSDDPGGLGDDIDHAMVRIIYRYGGDRVPEFVLGGLAGVASRGMDLLPAFFLAIAIDSLFLNERAFGLPLVPDARLPTTAGAQFALLLGIVGGVYLLQAALNWTNSWAWNHFAQRLQHEVRTETYDAMQALDMEFYDEKRTGEVMSILNNDVNQLENFLTSNLNMGIRIGVAVFGTLIVMLLVNWQLALVAVAIVPLLAGTSLAFMRIVGPKYRRVRASVGAMNARLENNIAGIEVVKAFTTETFESARVEESSREYLDANWDAISTRIKFWPTLQLLTGIGYLATLAIGGYWVMFGAPGPFSGELTAGVLVMFLSYTQQFMWPMMQFGQILNSYQYAEAAGERILGLIDRPQRESGDEGVVLDRVEGRVEYENVTFGYGGDGDPVLRNVSFTAEPGDYVGLVGPTGAGKTTLIELLLRFYDVPGRSPDGRPGSAGDSDGVNGGTVRVDGHDVREISLGSLRGAIGYVGQEPYLFYGSVRDNIAYGTADADDEAVTEAARLAGAHGFVTALPEGYDTMVGERGVKLSGGQRQRLSIARAVLRDPEILVLDEATSHVDNETEVLIRNGLDELVEDRTTLAIAHRLSTVRDADTILVLDDGEIVERGTHEELLAEDGLYANLWRVQVGEIRDLPPAFVERAARRQDALLPQDGARSGPPTARE